MSFIARKIDCSIESPFMNGIHSFVHYQMTTISNKETFIQVFVEKRLVLCETFHGNILTRGLSHKCLTL